MFVVSAAAYISHDVTRETTTDAAAVVTEASHAQHRYAGTQQGYLAALFYAASR